MSFCARCCRYICCCSVAAAAAAALAAVSPAATLHLQPLPLLNLVLRVLLSDHSEAFAACTQWLHIEDPFETSHNVADVLMKKNERRVYNEIKRAAEMLANGATLRAVM